MRRTDGLKKCTKCKQLKPLSNFGSDSSRGDGKKVMCGDCAHAYNTIKVVLPCSDCGQSYILTQSQARYGRHNRRLCSSCIRKLKSSRNKKQIGPLNPNWKNGATSIADKFYNSKEWKTVRTEAFIRDNYTCVDCGQVGHQLEANHIKPRSRFPELALVLDNIETLCKKCHDSKKWQVYRDTF